MGVPTIKPGVFTRAFVFPCPRCGSYVQYVVHVKRDEEYTPLPGGEQAVRHTKIELLCPVCEDKQGLEITIWHLKRFDLFDWGMPDL